MAAAHDAETSPDAQARAFRVAGWHHPCSIRRERHTGSPSLRGTTIGTEEIPGAMLIHLSLVAGGPTASSSMVEVQTAVQVDTADPRWPGWLVDAITQQAQEGAKRLVAQLAPPLPSAGECPFVPLADVTPIADRWPRDAY
jgi:hypothetical protein